MIKTKSEVDRKIEQVCMCVCACVCVCVCVCVCTLLP